MVVRQDSQGRGLGRLLMQAAVQDAGARTLSLVATTAGLKLYQSLGFDEIGGIEQWQGSVAPSAQPGRTALPASPAPQTGVALREFTDADLPAARALDAAALGAARDALLDAVWHGARRGVAAVQGGQLRGFALLRAAGHGTTVGPLIATDEALAASVAAQAIALAVTTATTTASAASAGGNEIVRFDIPAAAALLARQLEQAGLRCVDRVTLMRRGEALASTPLSRHPLMDAPQRYGLVSQAFG